WLVSTDGRQRRRFTEAVRRHGLPRWSPDGGRIAWISDRAIRVKAVDGVGESQVAEVETAPLALAWSLDGQQLAFTMRRASAPPGWAPREILPRLHVPNNAPAQLFVVSSGGGVPRRISDADYLDEPAWMPDGRT